MCLTNVKIITRIQTNKNIRTVARSHSLTQFYFFIIKNLGNKKII